MKEAMMKYLSLAAAITSLANGANMLYVHFHPISPIVNIQNLEITCSNCPQPYQKLVRTAKPAQYDAAKQKLSLDYLLAKN